MSPTLFRAGTGAALLCGVLGGVALAKSAPPSPAVSSDRIPVDLVIRYGMSGRLYCLTPSERGRILLPATKVPRRTCMGAQGWAARGVVFEDE